MNFLLFVRRNYLLQAVVLTGLFLGLIVYAKFLDGHGKLDWLDPIIGFATFLVAITIWLNGIWKNYMENLQKRLTVFFQFEGRNVLACYDALLFNVADARAWSQQIGAQMCGGNRDLKMEPFYRLDDRGIKTMPKSKQKVRSFCITIFLTSLPEFGDKNVSPELKTSFKEKLEKGCLEWFPIENEDGSFTVESGWMAGNKQKIRI